MSTRAQRYWALRRVALAREALAGEPGMSDADVASYVEDALSDEEYDAHCDMQEDIAMGRAPGAEDSPCIEHGRHNCNDAGTGEGQFHGRIG
jgi:hypothetical protein